ncbi:MAG: polysaccharide export protein [Deltaproteobacteria bacterium]|nr:polysaccharide export protein [Deltaproteobacteria bacterium]
MARRRPGRAALLLLALAGSVCAIACASGTTTQQTVDPGSDDTTLGPGDSFEVRVYGEEDLSSKYRVAQDGSIDFPLIGRIQVASREPTEVQAMIAQRLRDGGILVEPQVSVLVESYESKRVSVMGAVSQSGTFPMRSGLTVVQAISLAGGFTPLADRNSTVVTRGEGDALRRFRIRVDDVTRGEADDFRLRSGDIVYVPERLF